MQFGRWNFSGRSGAHPETALQLIHSLAAPPKAAEHAAGQLLGARLPQHCSQSRLHLQSPNLLQQNTTCNSLQEGAVSVLQDEEFVGSTQGCLWLAEAL